MDRIQIYKFDHAKYKKPQFKQEPEGVTNRCPRLPTQPSVLSQQNDTSNRKIGFQASLSSGEASAMSHALLPRPLVTCQLIDFRCPCVPSGSLVGFSAQYWLAKG